MWSLTRYVHGCISAYVVQKNPGATRHPEEDKGVESYQMDLMVDLSLSHLISPHIAQVCEDATDATYIRDMDLKLISTSKIHKLSVCIKGPVYSTYYLVYVLDYLFSLFIERFNIIYCLFINQTHLHK